MKTKKLFEPIYIGSLEIKNRIVMAPINTTNLYPPNEGTVPQRVIDYYFERAKGGVGLIITGVFKVENQIENYQKDGVRVWQVLTPNALPGLAELADYVHGLDTKIFVQLSAGPGRVARGDVIDAGFTPVSSSPNPAFFRPEVICRELKEDEVDKIIAAFGYAAQILAAAGIDGVEIHGHEGYLIDQFLTSLWNRRNDRYGGALMRRLNIALEILKTVKSKAGRDFPVTFRYGIKHFIKEVWKSSLKSDDFVEVGRDLEESMEIAKILAEAGYDALHIDTGCYESMYWAHPPTYQSDACMADLLGGVKNIVDIPIIAVGKLGTPEIAENILQGNIADMIAVGRPLLADPQWPSKVRSGKVTDIRPCIGCHEGCFRLPAAQNKPMSCSVNPSCGRERFYSLKRSHDTRRVLVIGGGVAGMEIARTATQRGYDVILFEKTEHLGGHLREACVPEFKKDLEKLLEWYERQMTLLKIEVNLNSEVTSALIDEFDYDVAVLATGSVPDLPSIQGVEKPFVTDCCEVLAGRRQVGDNVIVLGGGLEGCETGLWLAQKGKSVSIIETLEDIATTIHHANRQMLLDMIDDLEIKVLTKSKVVEILDDGIVVEDETPNRRFVVCDNLILAAGLKPLNDLYGALRNRGRPFHLIGDCKEPRNIHHAILEGFHVGHSAI